MSLRQLPPETANANNNIVAINHRHRSRGIEAAVWRRGCRWCRNFLARKQTTTNKDLSELLLIIIYLSITCS